LVSESAHLLGKIVNRNCSWNFCLYFWHNCSTGFSMEISQI